MVGEHYKKVMKNIDEIGVLIGLSDAQKKAAKDMYGVLKILNKPDPSEQEIAKVKQDYKIFTDNWISHFIPGQNFNYLHLLLHIVEDLQIHGYSAPFSGASFEHWNKILKKIIKTQTNKRDDLEKDYLLQTLDIVTCENHLISLQAKELAKEALESSN